MEFEKVIKERYSTCSFDGKPVGKNQLERILNAGRIAPTACNNQPQKIYVLQSAEALKKMDTVSACRYGAGTALLVCSDRNIAWHMPNGFSSFEQDASIVATHMLLEAANIGLDNIWTGIYEREKVRAAFGLPDNIEPICFIDLGHATADCRPRAWHSQRKPLTETVSFI